MRTVNRPVLYTEQEELLRSKKITKLEAQRQQEEHQVSVQDREETTEERTSRKRKGDSIEVKQKKNEKRIERKKYRTDIPDETVEPDEMGEPDEIAEPDVMGEPVDMDEPDDQTSDPSVSDIQRSDTNDEGESSTSAVKRSKRTPTVKEVLRNAFPEGFKRFTVSLPLSSCIRPDSADKFASHSRLVSEFIRTVIFKTQLFINYFIITSCSNGIPKQFFNQNFLYKCCQLTMSRCEVKDIEKQYGAIPRLNSTYQSFLTMHPSWTITSPAPKGFSQSLSDACIVLEHAYANFYVETFQHCIITFLMHCIMNNFPQITPGIAKNIAENYGIYTITRTESPNVNNIPVDFRDAVKVFIDTDTNINGLRVLAPSTSVDKSTITGSPGSVLPMLRYILRSLESMTYFYHRETLQKVVTSANAALKSANTLRETSKWEAASFDLMKESISMTLASLEDDQLEFTTDQVELYMDTFESQINALAKSRTINMKYLTSFSESVKELSKSANYSPFTSESTRNSIKNLEDTATEISDQRAILGQIIDLVPNLIERSSNVIADDNSSYDQQVKSIKDIDNALDFESSLLSAFAESSVSALTTIALATKADLDNYVDTITVVSPPAISNNNSAATDENSSFDIDETAEIPSSCITSNIARLPKLYALFPSPNFHWRFIKVNGQNINCFTPIKYTPKVKTFESNSEEFIKVFDFTYIHGLEKVDSVQKLLRLPIDKDKIFLNEIKTDGYSCRFSFARRRISSTTEPGLNNINLTLEDFTSAEIQECFNPVTLDPGRTQIFSAYYGNQQKRRFSAKEYYHYGGNGTRFKKADDRKKNVHIGERSIKEIETNIPSYKSTNIDSYNRHSTYILAHLNSLFGFYNFEHTAECNWRNKVSREAALEEAVNILINGGKKYSKNKRRKRGNKRKRREGRKRKKASRPPITREQPQESFTKNTNRRHNFQRSDKHKMPLVVFGSGMFGKDGVHFKGHQHGVTRLLYNKLKQREALGELCLLNIGEYYTSQVCNNCKTRNLKKMRNSKGTSIHSTLHCKACERLIWNRDVMASKNMWDISWSIWRGEGRPEAFKPQPQPQPLPQSQQQ